MDKDIIIAKLNSVKRRKMKFDSLDPEYKKAAIMDVVRFTNDLEQKFGLQSGKSYPLAERLERQDMFNRSMDQMYDRVLKRYMFMDKLKYDARKKYRVVENLGWKGQGPGNLGHDYYGRLMYIEGMPFADGDMTQYSNKNQKKCTDYGINKKAAIRDSDPEFLKKYFKCFGNSNERADMLIERMNPKLEEYYRKKKTARKAKSKRKPVKRCRCK